LMECVVLAENAFLRQRTVWAVENQGEQWRCRAFGSASSAREALEDGALVLLVDESEGSAQLLHSLQESPVLCPPWVLGVQEAEGLTAYLAQRRREVPPLARMQAEKLLPLAKGLTRALGISPGMGAQEFLPLMLALCSVHPPLMEDFKGRLYPLCAQACGLSAAAVERRLRLCVESCWTKGELRALERFFGHSVDPERGKPTNREFIFRLQEHLSFAGKRICR